MSVFVRGIPAPPTVRISTLPSRCGVSEYVRICDVPFTRCIGECSSGLGADGDGEFEAFMVGRKEVNLSSLEERIKNNEARLISRRVERVVIAEQFPLSTALREQYWRDRV